MKNVIARVALLVVATALSCSLANAQTAAPNPHPLTGHGPSVNAPLPAASQQPSTVAATCAPGFSSPQSPVLPGSNYDCVATAPTCPTGELTPGATLDQTGFTYACKMTAPTCPSGYSLKTVTAAQGAVSYTCKLDSYTCNANMAGGYSPAATQGSTKPTYFCEAAPH